MEIFTPVSGFSVSGRTPGPLFSVSGRTPGPPFSVSGRTPVHLLLVSGRTPDVIKCVDETTSAIQDNVLLPTQELVVVRGGDNPNYCPRHQIHAASVGKLHQLPEHVRLKARHSESGVGAAVMINLRENIS